MMKQQEVFNKIGGIIKEINDQYQYLETTQGQLNDLELELFVANTHFLADHAEVLRKINAQNAPAKPIEEEKPVTTEKPTTEPAPSHEEVFFEPVIQTGNSIPRDEPKPEIIRHELEVDESWTEDEELTEEEEIGTEPEKIKAINTEVVEIPEQIEEPKIEAAVIPAKTEVDEVYTINQKISAQMGKTEPALLPITDLKSAITLNDKLLFVKDLFNGYSLAYSEAIEILNRFTGLEEADTFLKKNYSTKNNWESKPQTTEKFYELLKRRYA
jgi:hypothetical protein